MIWKQNPRSAFPYHPTKKSQKFWALTNFVKNFATTKKLITWIHDVTFCKSRGLKWSPVHVIRANTGFWYIFGDRKQRNSQIKSRQITRATRTWTWGRSFHDVFHGTHSRTAVWRPKCDRFSRFRMNHAVRYGVVTRTVILSIDLSSWKIYKIKSFLEWLKFWI